MYRSTFLKCRSVHCRPTQIGPASSNQRNMLPVVKMERTAYRQCTSISLMSTKWSEQPTDSVHQSRSCLQNGVNSLQTVYINLAHVYKMERTAYRQCTSISLMSTKWSEQPTDSVHQSRSCLQNGVNSLQTVYINLAHVYKMERTAYRQCTSISLMSTQ